MKSNLDKAKAAFEKAKEDVERWERQAQQRAIDLDDAEMRLGESVVENIAPDARINKESTQAAIEKAASRIASLRSEKEAAEAAARTAKTKLDEAERAVWLAEAEELRERATELRREADSRQKKTDKLLADLRDFEGVAYIPEPPAEEAARVAGMPAGLSAPVRFIATPRTEALRIEASQLEREAIQLEERAADTPESRREKEEAERKTREETFRQTNEENRARYLESRSGRVLDPPLGV